MKTERPQGTRSLTERQASFLALAEEGLSRQEIAARQGVTVQTVSCVLFFIRNRDIGPNRQLTARQLEILCMVGAGMSYPQIAGKLFLATRTIENQITLACDRMGAKNRIHCAMLAVAQELLILDHDGQLVVPQHRAVVAA